MACPHREEDWLSISFVPVVVPVAVVVAAPSFLWVDFASALAAAVAVARTTVAHFEGVG